MITRLDLINFKGFDRFTIQFRGDAYLAGPNNAGKSTVIAALRACAYMLRTAQRRRPTDVIQDGDTEYLGFYFNSASVALVEENLRHEFRDLESRIAVQFGRRKRLVAVWPTEPDESPFYYLVSDGVSVHSAREAQETFPEVGIVPILAPIDQQEIQLTPKYVRENLDGRLASRHFRNQLWLLREEPGHTDLQSYFAFVTEWSTDLSLVELTTHIGERDVELDLYYRELGGRTEKETFWAGDGIQIWLQILLHVFRLRTADVVILDEPDVFLHPDLQRRTVRLLDALNAQTISATHSAEVLAEAPLDAVVWVDRTRRRAVRAPDAGTLFQLSAKLGSQFNIRLARALRSKVVLFVEGKDMRLIRHIAETIGAQHVAHELELTVVPIEGFDNWDRVEPFKWLVDDLLEHSIKVFVVLDRDYRTDTACTSVKRRSAYAGVTGLVWKRKELESYFIEPLLLARLSDTTVEWIEDALESITAELESYVFALFTTERQKATPRDHHVQAVRDAKRDFDALWADRGGRLHICPPKEVLSRLNEALQADGKKALSFPAIARSMRLDEVPAELAGVLERVEEAAVAA